MNFLTVGTKSPNFEHVFDVFLSQAALEGLKVRFLDRVSVFFSVAGRPGGLKSDFGIGFRVFFLSKAALEGLVGSPRALGALGGPWFRILPINRIPWGPMGPTDPYGPLAHSIKCAAPMAALRGIQRARAAVHRRYECGCIWQSCRRLTSHSWKGNHHRGLTGPAGVAGITKTGHHRRMGPKHSPNCGPSLGPWSHKLGPGPKL